MDNINNKLRKKVITLIICQAVILTGCGKVITESNQKEIISEVESATEQSSSIGEIEESSDKEQNTAEMEIIEENIIQSETEEKEIESLRDNFAECELTDEDFDVEYKGYTINRQTTAEELQSNLGVPEDFEDNNNGYIATVGQEWRWQIEYPDFANQSDIRVVFYTDLDTDETDIKMVALENVETYRGVKVGDTINTIYEKYGLPVEEKQSDSNAEYLELNYAKDDQRISFVIDEKNEMVKHIYIDYNLSEDEI